jgi:threonine dehydrogenase-like Zn-dependent dehydrogenase
MNVHQLVSHRFDLDKVTDAFAFAADNPAQTIKLMVQTR